MRSEKREELSQTLHSIVKQVRQESGCLHAFVCQDVENENDFWVVEEWATRKDLDDHVRSDTFTVLIGAGSLLRQAPELVVHTVSHSAKLEV